MPANVSLNTRPMVIAGFAKLVELVKKYAAPMYAPTAGGPGGASGAHEGEDHQDETSRGHDLREQVAAGDAIGRAPGDGGFCEHQVRENRARDAAEDLRGNVAGDVRDRAPAERGVDERDDRVEVRAATGPKTRMSTARPRAVAKALSSSWSPASAVRDVCARCRSRPRSPPGARCRGTRRRSGARVDPASRREQGCATESSAPGTRLKYAQVPRLDCA